MMDGVKLTPIALFLVTTVLACHTLTPVQTAGVSAVVGAGCALAEGVPLPAVLAPFKPLEPVACAGLESFLAFELGQLAPTPDAGAGLGVATAAVVSAPLPRRAVYHDGVLCGFARVAAQ